MLTPFQRAMICGAAVGLGALGGCGSTSSSTAQPPPRPIETDAQRVAAAERAERARRAELGARHRALLDEQATALAATCDSGAVQTKQNCTPSCYPAEPVDARAGKKLRGAAEIVHLACTRSPAKDPPFLLADEVGGAQLAARAVRGRLPASHRAGTWQAAVEAEVKTALQPELARGDVIRVTGAWKASTHPVTKERLQCVTVSHYVKSFGKALDACGSRRGIACEAAGNLAAHGLNVVHYRLAEARRLQAADKDMECRQAALEAIAIARGMPRWRQYMMLNTDRWKGAQRYRTRFDGTLDEDTLFTTAVALGAEAQAVHVACGGTETPPTTAADEQAFHSCSRD